jgi:anaerobic selenocysteine-containing dehydrogenase
MTPTAALADIVLPVASHFEFDDIGHLGIGHGFILARPKVVELSPAEHWHDDYRQFLEDVVQPAGLTYGEFCEKGYLKGPGRFRLYEEKSFRTPTGKGALRTSMTGTKPTSTCSRPRRNWAGRMERPT